MSETRHTKVLIIGSGPAGYSAGVYASRAMLEPILVQGIEPGGQLTTTTEVENGDGSLRSTSVTTTSDDGLWSETRTDVDGDGQIERIETSNTVLDLNNAGQATGARATYNGVKSYDGSLLSAVQSFRRQPL